VPFVIWCNQRSGSTHLSSLLASHPQIFCWRELFFAGEAGSAEDYFTRSKCSDLRIFLDRFFSSEWAAINLCEERPTTKQPRAVGFKLKYQQVERYPGVGQYLLSGRSTIRIIHLVRVNLLAALVSARILPLVFARFKDANVLADTPLDGFQPAIRLDPTTLYFDLDFLMSELTRAREFAANFNTIEVTYEDLVRNFSSTSECLLRFLSLNDSTSVLQSRYRKLLPRQPLASISNKREVRIALQGTRFEGCLSEWS
jgi:hypothetical protein